ncbi:MAG: helix-turn-helix transcriptional regulator [Planctomycetes bacterium]|nr:helix-turn-helix transcriptional regulator [Planctomycetota bacterium]
MDSDGVLVDHAGFWRGPRAVGFQTPWRSLPWLVVQAVESGTYRIDHASGSTPLPAGSVWLVPSGCRHRHAVSGSTPVMSHHVHLIVRMRGVLDPCAHLGAPRIFPDALATRLGRALRAASEAPRGSGTVEALRRHALVADLAAELIAALGSDASGDEALLRIAPALAFIDAHLHLPLSREEIATRNRCSVSRLHQLFRAATGEAPQTWIRRRRLERAAALLAGTGLGTAEIAERCGFCDPYHLNKRFRAAYGMPPTAWRRQAGE